jgi:hypothetical protein
MSKAAQLAAYQAGLKTALIEFTDGDDAIAIADAGVVTLLTTAVAKSEGGAVTTNITQGLCKMWARLDGTGTIGLDDSFNVGSTTDAGTGNYRFTFTTNMGNATFNVSHASANQIQIHSAEATSSVSILCRSDASSDEDVDPAFSNVHGDLA